MPEPIIAHTREDGTIQTLPEHIEGVAHHCALFLEQAGLPELAPLGRLLAQLHDVGKAQPAFQRYIRGESVAKAPHSAAGALLVRALRGAPAQETTPYLPTPSLCHQWTPPRAIQLWRARG
mgnify:CR=1 FL=1